MVHSDVFFQLRSALAHLGLQGSSEKSIWASLYYAASMEGKNLPSMFPKADPSAFPKSWAGAMSSSDGSFYKSKEENVTHLGRNCGRKFQKGEPIYRCLDCAFDNTCVLCVHCFNKEDHVGHQVRANICTDTNNGICDCGDPEAWKRELHCKCNLKAAQENGNDDSLFDSEYEEFLKNIYDICLDFIIEVFAHQTQTLPSVNQEIKKWTANQSEFRTSVKEFEKDVRKKVLSPRKYGEHEELQNNCLVIWNDEFHNFTEAQAAIISATSDSHSRAESIASDIDEEGRTLLIESPMVLLLLHGFHAVQFNGLTASIMSFGNFLRQEHCKDIIDWIMDTINFPNTNFQKIARRALCKSLCSIYDTDGMVSPELSKLYAPSSGLLDGKNLPQVQKFTIDTGKSITSQNTKLSSILDTKSQLAQQTRLQFLLYFDVRYWKVLRKKVHDFLITTLVSDLEYKAIACQQIVEIYGLLINNLSKLDREPHLNALDEIACQFFTCPTNSTNIIGTNNIRDVLYPITLLFEGFSKYRVSGDVFKIPPRSLDKSTSIRKSFTRTINDLTYTFGKTASLNNFFLPENFMPFCYLTRLFDSNWEIQRKVGDHVENESYDFVDYFSYSLQLLGVIYAATDSAKINPVDKAVVAEATRRLLHLLSLKPVSKVKVFKSYQLIDIQVSKDLTAFMNPSNLLLSRLFQILAKSTEEVAFVIQGFNFLNIVDSSLRAIVLCTQIEAQFWIRNGINSLKQAHMYKSPQLLHDSVYYRDAHLVQLAFLATDPERAFLSVLNSFELLEWFSNKVKLDSTIYGDKVFTIIEKLIGFFYAILSERSLFLEFDSVEKELRYKLKQVLIYTLYNKPLTYSEIEESLSEEFKEFEFLDDVLNDVTNFTPPRGLNDDGRYSLKNECYKLIDPLKLLAQGKDFQDNVSVITKALAEQSDKAAEDIIIEPKLSKIESFKSLGDFTRTIEFAKFIYKLLEYSVQNNYESFVPQLLHLLHAVYKDAEATKGKGFVIESFVQIPVCESLFAIANSTEFSKQTTRKADYLLESLIVKDSRQFFESLISCFGEDAVNAYKEKKKSSGVNFDESEPERKRRIAKERQKKILEKMSKKQKLFLQKNDADTEEDDKESISAAPEDSRNCVLCQGPQMAGDLFGIPVSFVKSSIFRNLPLKDKYFIRRGFKNWEDDSVGSDPDAVGLGFPLAEGSVRNFNTSHIASSCNHGMHFRCLQEYMREHNHTTPAFSCPLCKTFHNQFLPISKLKNNSMDASVLKNVKKPVVRTFITSLVDVEPLPLVDYHNLMRLVLGKHTPPDFFLKLVRIFASSLSQAEISTRINGASSYSDFLKQISEQSYKVLRGLFQSLLLFEETNDLYLDGFEITQGSKHHDLSFDFVFNIFTAVEKYEDYTLFLQKLIGRDTNYYLISLLKRVEKYGDFSVDLKWKGTKIRNLLAFRKLVEGNSEISDQIKKRFLTNDTFASKIVNLTELLLLPSLRTICIFYKIVYFELDLHHDNEKKFVDIDTLLKCLGLPKFDQIITSTETHSLIKNPKAGSMGKLPFPGVIKLVDLPPVLNYFTTTTNENSQDQIKRFKPDGSVQNSNNRIDFSVCLTCGSKVFKTDQRNEKFVHLGSQECDSGPDALFLSPNTDVVHLISVSVAGRYSKSVNAPFLNSHGQSGAKAVQNGQIATLNIERYKYLNNLWLTGSIFSYLSRNSSPIFPRFGLEDAAEQRFWQQFLANARADIEQNLDDDEQFVATFPPGANYVDELRTAVFDEDDDEDDDDSLSETSDGDVPGEGETFLNFEEDESDFYSDSLLGEEFEDEFEEGELDHFEDIDEDFMTDEEGVDVFYDADMNRSYSDDEHMDFGDFGEDEVD